MGTFVNCNTQTLTATFAVAGIEHLEYSAQDLKEMADTVTNLDSSGQIDGGVVFILRKNDKIFS